eukprot:4773169-Ditylum_brightwellii.AAC.1
MDAEETPKSFQGYEVLQDSWLQGNGVKHCLQDLDQVLLGSVEETDQSKVTNTAHSVEDH